MRQCGGDVFFHIYVLCAREGRIRDIYVVMGPIVFVIDFFGGRLCLLFSACLVENLPRRTVEYYCAGQ